MCGFFGKKELLGLSTRTTESQDRLVFFFFFFSKTLVAS